MGKGGLTGQRMRIDEIREQLGHTSIAMALYYSTGTDDDVGDAFAAAKITEAVDVPTRERAKVIPPSNVLGLLEASGAIDPVTFAKIAKLLDEEEKKTG